MKNLLKKFRENKKGFTLAELLVVVAIIGILVAVSIPVFTAQLSKARKATNEANLRAAKAAAVAAYLTDDTKNDGEEETYVYNLTDGTATAGTAVSTTTADPANVDSDKTYKEISVKIQKKNDKSGNMEFIFNVVK